MGINSLTFVSTHPEGRVIYSGNILIIQRTTVYTIQGPKTPYC